MSTPSRRNSLFELKFSQDVGHILIFHLKSIKLILGVKGGDGGSKGGLELGRGSEMLFELKFSQDVGHIVIFHLKSIKLILGVKGGNGGSKGGLGLVRGSEMLFELKLGNLRNT